MLPATLDQLAGAHAAAVLLVEQVDKSLDTQKLT